MKAHSVVLVVDDDPTIREMVALTLEDEGYQVVTAADGAAALHYVNQQRPGLILLDMRMPIMDGWAFAKAYRQTLGQHAPIIAMTAATDAGASAAQIKADGFLAKPFDLNNLSQIVQQHIQ